MICPMTFSNPEIFSHGAMECEASCAWAFEWNDKVSCAIAILCVGKQWANTQPLEDDNTNGGE